MQPAVLNRNVSIHPLLPQIVCEVHFLMHYLFYSALSSLSVGSIMMVPGTGKLIVGAWKP